MNTQLSRKLVHFASPFIAYESTVQGAPTTANSKRSAFLQRKDVPSHGFSKVELGGHGNSSAEHSKTDFFQKKGCSNDLSSQKVNGKRQRKKEAESSESCDIDNSIKTVGDVLVDEDCEVKAEVDLGCHVERPRRSDRRKQHVSYKENLSDDEDFANHPKKAKRTEERRNGLKKDFFKTNDHSSLKDQSAVKQKEGPESISNEIKDNKNVERKEAEENDCKKASEACSDSTSDSSSKITSDPEFYDYPDLDFNDFDKVRNDKSF
ncbi:hypothetical protein RCOM_0679490 [Ricinus communis]|uniref:Uncharacterized protein n=1 Tax=Ricinus communis TaxID=3988 RepID=B9RSY5_RICCO|nr:hypothetical protein RCOM_0679490 [Ricinus communis]